MSVTIIMAASSQSASLIEGFTFIVIWFSNDAYSFKAFQLPPLYRYINRCWFLLPLIPKNIINLPLPSVGSRPLALDPTEGRGEQRKLFML
jgi:hypothetical protein